MIGVLTLVRREIRRFLSVANNTLVPALVSSLLYLIIFGVGLGSRIGGDQAEYLAFLIPGLIMMNMINGSYANPSGSIFMSRLLGYINDILLSSLSYLEMVIAYVAGGIARGTILALGTWIISAFFSPIQIHDIGIFFLYTLLTTITFASIGMLVGLWAQKWDQLNLLVNFVITPLVFLGGVFYSIEAIPPALQTFTRFNPIFYMVNGLRYSITGFSEANIWIGAAVLAVIGSVLLLACVQIFRTGWRLRT